MDQETKSGYEPGRIPTSVFTPSMTPKQDWSMQSSESLFSIHMADQSFTKLYKSGDLTNFDYTASYLNNNNIDNKINLTDAGTKEVSIPVVETGPKTTNREVLTIASKPDPPQPAILSPTNRSDTSNNSAASFAFPAFPGYQQDRKTSLNMNNESGKKDISRHDHPKPGGNGAWLTCFFCFSVKN